MELVARVQSAEEHLRPRCGPFVANMGPVVAHIWPKVVHLVTCVGKNGANLKKLTGVQWSH
jgi:hypothetical protein